MKRTMEYVARAAAHALESNDAVEVVLTPGNGCRYSIVLSAPTSLEKQDVREYATVQSGSLLVSMPDFHACMVWTPGHGGLHESYIAEKMPRLFPGDVAVVAEFLGRLAEEVSALAGA